MPSTVKKSVTRSPIDDRIPSSPPLDDEANITPWSEVCRLVQRKKKTRMPKVLTPFAPATREKVEETPDVMDEHFFSPRPKIVKRRREASEYALQWVNNQEFNRSEQPLIQFARTMAIEEEGGSQKRRKYNEDTIKSEAFDQEDEAGEDKQSSEEEELNENSQEEGDEQSLEGGHEDEDEDEGGVEDEYNEYQDGDDEYEETADDEDGDDDKEGERREVLAEIKQRGAEEEISNESSAISDWSGFTEDERLYWIFKGKGISNKYRRENFAKKEGQEDGWLRRTKEFYRPERREKLYLRSPCIGRGPSGKYRDQDADWGSSDEELVFVPTPPCQESPEKGLPKGAEEQGEGASETESVPEFILNIARGNARGDASPKKQEPKDEDEWSFVHKITSVDEKAEWKYEIKVFRNNKE
ncbi:hypothetical protein TWF192_003229 [Orbilia oligospora]|uniref:Uncharacterized protein n=1 Tax=Orbilia oligospora TaxID=2813651 RepID=A0A6G1MEL5_ORBOL|nr:hypothetical protein TWF679_006861 [Orbilia oligospora]KAF3225329.1 hypothetical protein TWF191_005380 [Orbilia oligospora]KAF3254468.1 hypothetical protein TWF192_003229 [Orbilia oligospora]